MTSIYDEAIGFLSSTPTLIAFALARHISRSILFCLFMLPRALSITDDHPSSGH